MLLRSTLIYGPAILFTRVSALLLLIVVTRLINQEEYGLLTLVVTVGEMTDAAVTNWLRIALIRLGGTGNISRGSLALAGKVMLCTTMLALAVAATASAFVVPGRWVEFSIAVCTYLIVSAIGRFALTTLQMQQRHSTYSLLECLRGLLQLAFPIGAIVIFPKTFLVVSLGTSAGMLIAGVIAFVVALRRVTTGPARFTARELFSLGLPLVAVALVGFGMNSSERLFLNAFHDATAVAIFAAAYILARQPIDIVGHAINVGTFPEVMSRFDEEGPVASGELLSQVMALMMQLCLPVAAMLVALNGEVTQLLLPQSYHGRTGLLFPAVAFAAVCANLTSVVYGAVIHAHKRPWLLIIATSLGSVATIALSVILIPTLDEFGAAVALAGGSAMALAACVVIGERLTPIPVLWRDIALSLATACATGIAAYLVATLLRDMPVLVPLIGGGAAGASMLLLMTWLFRPAEVRKVFTAIRRHIGAAQG